MDGAPRTSWQRIGFAAAVFISAFLLFQVQPLVSKQILPWFGGSPSVWTTCLLFFQTVLFAGYVYAHLCIAFLRSRQQAMVHLALIVTATVFLQVLPSDDWKPRQAVDPVWRILWMLTASMGPAYLTISATGPLLQAWFSRLFPGRAPYRLYALSNLGSLLALVSYPFFFEPFWDLTQQAQLWTGGFVAFALLTTYAALHMWIAGGDPSPRPNTESAPAPPRWSQYFVWLVWPALASIVLMATTNHVCTDVAAMPFLWVAPLALYLATFIIAFDHARWHRPTLTAVITLAAVYGSALVYKEGVGWIDLYNCGMTGRCAQLVLEPEPEEKNAAAETERSTGPRVYIGFVPFLAMNLTAMFGVCLLCHGELARHRPDPRYLTSYYVMIAAGGALGGMAVALVAPRVFHTFLEWKLAMFAATIVALGLFLNALVNRAVASTDAPSRSPQSTLAPSLTLVILLLPASFVLLDLVEYLCTPKKGIQYQTRNFFGTLTIRERNPEVPQLHNRVLLHGTTVHGSQFIAPQRRGQPTTYYSTTSGVGRLLNYYRSQPPHGGIKIGDVGLGAGTLAAYAGAGDSICFYEIDPAIVQIATNGRWFTYLDDCQARGARCEIKLGDGRLTLENEQNKRQPPRYHVLVIDAFSGDAVPVHLLTREAFELYIARLTRADEDGEDGALAVNISNRYLDLEPVVRGAAAHFGMEALRIESPQIPHESINSAVWMILSRNEAVLKELARFVTQSDEPPKLAVHWTDAHSSLFQVLK
jgi:hypothetical protein